MKSNILHQYEKAIVSINSDQDVSCEFFEDLVITDEGEEEIYVGRTLLNRFILVPRMAEEKRDKKWEVYSSSFFPFG
ncbi:hypothetical protein P421_16130 [Heyndrickxia coagulans P38]|nr:hypothetical protein P421_16130 [Heyndrickxia coagulans P38]